MNTPPQHLLHRAISNALWLPLRRALQDGWPIVTDWQSHDPRGNPHSSDYRPGGTPAGPLPTYTPTVEAGRVIARLDPNQWPGGGHALYARLTEPDYRMIYAQLDMTQMHDWLTCLRDSTARVPFLLDANRHGTPILRRNHDPLALITPLVSDVLVTLASLAEVRLLTPAEEQAHLDALRDDTPDPMRPTELFAIASRSGIDEPE